MKTSTLQKRFLLVIRDFIILALLGNGLTLFTFPVKFLTMEIFLRNCLLSIAIGYPTWKGIDFIHKELDRKLPWLKFPLKRMIFQVTIMVLFSGLVMGSGMVLWSLLVEGISLNTISEYGMKSLLLGFGFLFFSLLIGNAVLFFKNWRNAAIQQEELKRAHLSLQYKSLKEQVKPHFLFNSLSSLVTLINTDTEKATEFVHKLSDVYRYLLEQRDNELVPVSDELKFVEDYAFLQKIRFGDNLHVNVNPGIDEKAMILPLSLQMMVENAIKHNEISKSHPLLIEIFSGDEHYIVIKNSLQRKDSSGESLGLGLENLKKRTLFFTDKPLFIKEDKEAFLVSIPTLVMQ